MALFYIPGASYPDGTPAEYIDSSEGFVLNDIQYPRRYLDRSELDGATRCTFEACPFDGTEYIITEHRNGPVIGWVGTPRDPGEVAALKKANRNAIARPKSTVSKRPSLTACGAKTLSAPIC